MSIFGDHFARYKNLPFFDPDQIAPATITGDDGTSAATDEMAQAISKAATNAGIGSGRVWKKHADQLLALLCGLPNSLGFFG